MPSLFSGEYRRRRGAYRRMSGGRRRRSRDDDGGRRVADPVPAATPGFMPDPAWRVLRFGGPAWTPRSRAAIAVFDWARHATVVFRGTAGRSGAHRSGVDGVEPQAWREASELALTNPDGRHAASVLGEDLSAASKFSPGDIALWDPLPFQIVEDQLHRWRDIALGAVRAATSAARRGQRHARVAVGAPRRAAARVGERRDAREPRRDLSALSMAIPIRGIAPRTRATRCSRCAAR